MSEEFIAKWNEALKNVLDEATEAAREGARISRLLYTSYIEEGFTEEQAMRLLLEMTRGGRRE